MVQATNSLVIIYAFGFVLFVCVLADVPLM